jgi:hypothetical protein
VVKSFGRRSGRSFSRAEGRWRSTARLMASVWKSCS